MNYQLLIGLLIIIIIILIIFTCTILIIKPACNLQYNYFHYNYMYFDYKINYPSLDRNIKCQDIIEKDILDLIQTQVQYKIDVLEYTNPKEVEEEDLFFWSEVWW